MDMQPSKGGARVQTRTYAEKETSSSRTTAPQPRTWIMARQTNSSISSRETPSWRFPFLKSKQVSAERSIFVFVTDSHSFARVEHSDQIRI